MPGCGKTARMTMDDRFWNAFRETAVREGIPYQWRALNDLVPDAEPSRCMRNFRIAAGKEKGEHGGFVFQDSDVAKWLEGVAYSLRGHPDPELERIADGAIADIVDAQQPDGYLNTYYAINGLQKRWTNLKDHHELYCAGHMIEAAVAYFQATGKRTLLDAMIRFVDHIDSVIGPEAGKLHGYPGHPVIEMALVRLYGVTHDPKHLRLAAYFINQRGQQPLFFVEEERRNGTGPAWKDSPFRYQYYQAGLPVREQADAEGHAVRAMYLYAGMADVARETGDESLAAAVKRLWASTTRRRMYVTGAVGSSEYGESFTFDYDLPGDTVYGETCASIGLVFLARRMLTLEKRGEYADVMERALYNGVLSGMQLDGKRFFYVNPLEVVPAACEKDAHKRHVKPERQKWFACACCPPNLIRLLTSLEDYVATATNDCLYLHLYVGGRVEAALHGTNVRLDVDTAYPWQGSVRIVVTPEREVRAAIALRIPGWCKRYALSVNGEPVPSAPEDGYVAVERTWTAGDRIELTLEMTPRFVRANPKVRENAGRVAVARGPIVYCVEEADNGADLHNLLADTRAPVAEAWEPELLGGVVTLTASGQRETDEGWGEALYALDKAPQRAAARLRLIPYYAWANRGVGEMRVFIREQ